MVPRVKNLQKYEARSISSGSVPFVQLTCEASPGRSTRAPRCPRGCCTHHWGAGVTLAPFQPRARIPHEQTLPAARPWHLPALLQHARLGLREAAEAVPARQEVPAPAAPARRSHRSNPSSCSEDICSAAPRNGSCCPNPCKW